MKILNLTKLHCGTQITIFVNHIEWLEDREDGGTIVAMSVAEHTVKETREEILRRIFG